MMAVPAFLKVYVLRIVAVIPIVARLASEFVLLILAKTAFAAALL